jgi:putative pyruvate formate lyase activating enzyme
VTLPEIFSGFVRPRASFEPAYLEAYRSGMLARKVEKALRMLRTCRVCPRYCDVDRTGGQLGVCASGRYADVASYFPHFGEEDCLRGWRGSGTVFFGRCNLKCVFCQNFEISRLNRGALPLRPEQLARVFLYLQERGCHNLNWVTPEHVVPQVLEALLLAVEEGLRLPIVYNTSAYDSMESLQLLDGVVDIYMPDFKYWDPEKARRYLKAPDYPEVARQAIREMYRQVGPLVVDEDGLALRGLLIRHLIMPGGLEDTRRILEWIVEELGPDTYVNLMDQYHPAGLVAQGRYPELKRPITDEEWAEAVAYARELGLWRLDRRWRPLQGLQWAG